MINFVHTPLYSASDVVLLCCGEGRGSWVVGGGERDATWNSDLTLTSQKMPTFEVTLSHYSRGIFT